jgi:hypothetical protein
MNADNLDRAAVLDARKDVQVHRREVREPILMGRCVRYQQPEQGDSAGSELRWFALLRDVL